MSKSLERRREIARRHEEEQSVPVSEQGEAMKQSIAKMLGELFPNISGVVLDDGTVLVSQQDIDKAKEGK